MQLLFYLLRKNKLQLNEKLIQIKNKSKVVVKKKVATAAAK